MIMEGGRPARCRSSLDAALFRGAVFGARRAFALALMRFARSRRAVPSQHNPRRLRPGSRQRRAQASRPWRLRRCTPPAHCSREADRAAGGKRMRTAARLGIFFALCLALVAANPEQNVAAFDQGKLVAPGRLVIAGRRLTCGATATLVRDFEGFAVSSTVIMINIEAMKDLPRPVQWLIYYHECGHIRYGPSETAADCYAVRRARREGWLDEKALDDICAVFNIAGH